MNNITADKVMDDIAMAFVPEYIDSSSQSYSILMQFINLLDYQIMTIYRIRTNMWMHKHRCSRPTEQTKKQKTKHRKGEVSVSVDWAP